MSDALRVVGATALAAVWSDATISEAQRVTIQVESIDDIGNAVKQGIESAGRMVDRERN